MAHEGKRHGFAASGNKSVAEILNANKNSVAELISQEMSNNLASTYSSGDAGLARQLEARTYGVNDDLSITPGTETKWVDEIGDKYGKSEQNVKIADEKAAAAEQLILDEKETIGSTAFGLSNSGTISKQDKKIFKEAKQQRLEESRERYRTTQKKLAGEQKMRDIDKAYPAVSYTHLTLPTICSV